MAAPPRFQRMLDKADAALISAIEIYNKPDFAYREETFAILAINAWELLLKGCILRDNGNDLRSLYVYERRRVKNGDWGKRKYIKRNRTGNAHTKHLFQLLNELSQDGPTGLPPAILHNLRALTEIRDNAVHFVNASPALAKQVLEIGTACVQNYVELARRWFNRDFSRYKLYLMPIGFVDASGTAAGLIVSGGEENLIGYLGQLMTKPTESGSGDYRVALTIDISLKKVTGAAVSSQHTTTSSGSIPAIELVEEDIRKIYSWDYATLTSRLRERYVDFVANQRYHDLRKPLKDDDRYVRTRHLDPANPKGIKKDFYNPNIVREFDEHYTLE